MRHRCAIIYSFTGYAHRRSWPMFNCSLCYEMQCRQTFFASITKVVAGVRVCYDGMLSSYLPVLQYQTKTWPVARARYWKDHIRADQRRPLTSHRFSRLRSCGTKQTFRMGFHAIAKHISPYIYLNCEHMNCIRDCRAKRKYHRARNVFEWAKIAT